MAELSHSDYFRYCETDNSRKLFCRNRIFRSNAAEKIDFHGID